MRHVETPGKFETSKFTPILPNFEKSYPSIITTTYHENEILDGDDFMMSGRENIILSKLGKIDVDC